MIDVQLARQVCIDKLTALLAAFLPKSDPREIQAGVVKIIDKAINLKRNMTAEFAVYRCVMFDRGNSFDPATMEHLDEDDTDGKILFCTFPTLLRYIPQDRGWMQMVVVKASVLLEREEDMSHISGNNAVERPIEETALGVVYTQV